jgi:hypothetical protein
VESTTHPPRARASPVNAGAGLGPRGTGVIGSANVDNVRKWHVRDVTPANTRAAAIKGAADLLARSAFMLRPRCRTLKALSCSDPHLGKCCSFGVCPAGDERTYGFGYITEPRTENPVAGRLNRPRRRFAGFGSIVPDDLPPGMRRPDPSRARKFGDEMVCAGPIALVWRRESSGNHAADRRRIPRESTLRPSRDPSCQSESPSYIAGSWVVVN